MPLVPMRELLADAVEHRYAVGYFEAWDQYSFEAVLEAAEECSSPVILGFGGMMMNQEWFKDRGLRALAAMGRVMAEGAKVPAAYLLNEVADLELIQQGIDAGFNAVMLDTSRLSFEENIRQTQKVVAAASKFGVDVEGECDPLPDASETGSEKTQHKLIDPEEAASYVAQTGVSALSVSIGNEHIKTEGESGIDFNLLMHIHQAVSVPLVIHGGTGFPNSAVPQAIKHGVAKFNVGSVLKSLFLQSVRDTMLALPAKPDVHEVVGSRKAGDYLSRAKTHIKDEVKRRMAVYGSVGRRQHI